MGWEWSAGVRSRNQARDSEPALRSGVRVLGVEGGPEVKVRVTGLAGGQYLVALHAAEAKAHLDSELRGGATGTTERWGCT